MNAKQIDVTFDENTLKPTLIFIESVKNGDFTDGGRISMFSQNRCDESIYLDNDTPSLIYGISY